MTDLLYRTTDAYEATLETLYERQSAIHAGHSNCAACKTDVVCDTLMNERGDAIEATFALTDARRWLDDLGDELLAWSVGELSSDTVAGAVVAALRYDAEERLFGEYGLAAQPRDPACTRPAL